MSFDALYDYIYCADSIGVFVLVHAVPSGTEVSGKAGSKRGCHMLSFKARKGTYDTLQVECPNVMFNIVYCGKSKEYL